jgi:hypothetical protein
MENSATPKTWKEQAVKPLEKRDLEEADEAVCDEASKRGIALAQLKAAVLQLWLQDCPLERIESLTCAWANITPTEYEIHRKGLATAVHGDSLEKAVAAVQIAMLEKNFHVNRGTLYRTCDD